MKKTLLIGLLTTFSISAADLSITIDNIANDYGNIRLAIFSEADKDNFPNGEPTIKMTTYAVLGKIHFDTIAAVGTYAISAYHDENNDKVLNMSFFGIPTEPYGFSNDARATFSAPDFEEAQFKLTKSGDKIIFDLQ